LQPPGRLLSVCVPSESRHGVAAAGREMVPHHDFALRTLLIVLVPSTSRNSALVRRSEQGKRPRSPPVRVKLLLAPAPSLAPPRGPEAGRREGVGAFARSFPVFRNRWGGDSPRTPVRTAPGFVRFVYALSAPRLPAQAATPRPPTTTFGVPSLLLRSARAILSSRGVGHVGDVVGEGRFNPRPHLGDVLTGHDPRWTAW